MVKNKKEKTLTKSSVLYTICTLFRIFQNIFFFKLNIPLNYGTD